MGSSTSPSYDPKPFAAFFTFFSRPKTPTPLFGVVNPNNPSFLEGSPGGERLELYDEVVERIASKKLVQEFCKSVESP